MSLGHWFENHAVKHSRTKSKWTIQNRSVTLMLLIFYEKKMQQRHMTRLHNAHIGWFERLHDNLGISSLG